jgi:hypothetical protein
MARGILTWTERNSDHPYVLFRGDEKENLTALPTVTAAGRRLPLFFLARGKTERVERSQIGDVAPHWVAHLSKQFRSDRVIPPRTSESWLFVPDGRENYRLVTILNGD